VIHISNQLDMPVPLVVMLTLKGDWKSSAPWLQRDMCRHVQTCAQVLQDVLSAGGRADAALYSTVIEAMWQADSPRLRAQAEHLFDGAARLGVFGLTAIKARQGDTLEARPVSQLDLAVH
jgi:hypothetical protein